MTNFRRFSAVFLFVFCSGALFAGTPGEIKKSSSFFFQDSIDVRSAPLSGPVYFLDCINGFGGGNVAASIGDDGILLTDDMFANMTAKLKASLAKLSGKPIRIVLNTHFHGDHIQGNINFHNLLSSLRRKMKLNNC